MRLARLTGSIATATVGAGVVLATLVLAAVHADDRYGVGAASGVWIGLGSALRDGVLYPPVYDNGFYGGTRYMPLPAFLEAGAGAITNELLVSAKLLIYAVAGGLYTLLYVVGRRRGAPRPIAIGLVGAVLATAAGSTTTLGIRWDGLATLLQLGAVAIVFEHETSRRRGALAGLCCGLALLAKITAVWAPVALVIWLAAAGRRSLGAFVASFLGSTAACLLLVELISSGRLFENLRLFAFGGSDGASALVGAHRLYQLALRDQREGAILLIVGALGVGLAFLARRASPYEIGFVVSVPVLLVVLRDAGAYENHLLDLLVLTAVVVAGMWSSAPQGRARALVHGLVVLAIVGSTLLAVRHTILPDLRSAAAHELRGTPNPRYAVHPLSGLPGAGRCELFEDATLPLLAGRRPVVLDAFMVHRLQTQRQADLALLEGRIRKRTFSRIVLTNPLTDLGWFAVLDFGSQLAEAMRDNYRLAVHTTDTNVWVYLPKARQTGDAVCRDASLSQW